MQTSLIPCSEANIPDTYFDTLIKYYTLYTLQIKNMNRIRLFKYVTANHYKWKCRNLRNPTLSFQHKNGRGTMRTIKEVEDFCFQMAKEHLVGKGLLIIEASRSPSTRQTTIGTTPLDEWSARRRDLYLTKHNTLKTHTSMPSAVF
jgi:hypothetical protein